MDRDYDSMQRFEERKRYLEERRRINRIKRKRRAMLRKIMPAAIIVIVLVVAAGIIFANGNKKHKDDKKVTVSLGHENVTVSESEEVSVPEDVIPEVIYPYVGNDPQKYGFYEGYTVNGLSSAPYVSDENMTSESAIIIDLADGHVVAQKNGNTRIYPASMTKVLTLLVAVEHITDLDDTVTITIDDTDYAFLNDLAAVNFDKGEIVTVRDLLYGTILQSGGDAAHALAVYVAGSEEAFADMMNDKLGELGLSSTTHFTNCSGIYNDNHYTTLADMAMIMKAAEENELCHEILGTRVYTTSKTPEHENGIEISNWFIRRIEDKDCHGSVSGAKTGFVNESGCCAVSYQVSNDGHQYICVTHNTWSSWRCIYDHVQMYQDYTN